MAQVKISWYGRHFGEEPPLTGDNGAGTIFFSGCNLHCIFCQNWQISQAGMGQGYTVEELTKIMLELQAQGAENIDLVTPTIWWKEIKAALISAREGGLFLPIVWNSNAFESVEVLKNMRGLVDIYLPDFKYADDDLAFKYSGIKNYTAVARAAIEEMLAQVGPWEEDKKRGVIIRHLILPGCLENSKKTLEIISKLSARPAVSLMCQYYPAYKAKEFPELNRVVTDKEFEEIYDYLLAVGLEKGWVQEPGSEETLLPDFSLDSPF